MATERIATVDDKNTAYIVAGNEKPAVILLSGLGERYQSWEPVFDEIAAFAQVFAYSRPGYGNSDNIPSSSQGRSGIEVANHLKDTLNAVGLAPPYILVGASMGGLYALDYAKLYLDDVVGMVLLDHKTATYTEECKKQNIGMCDGPPWYLKLFMSKAMRAEIDGSLLAEQQAQVPEGLGRRPVTVIAASKPDPGISQKVFTFWVNEQKKFADRLHNGKYLVAADSAHLIHIDRPDLVIAEIKAMAKAIRAADQMKQ